MPDDFLAAPAPTQRPSRLRGLFLTALIAFLLGGGVVGWLAWNGTLKLDFGQGVPDPAVSATAPAAQPRLPLVTAPAPSPSASVAPLTQPVAAGAFDQRVAALETRLNELDLRASAASGNAARAEGMLIAFATRRAIERGSGLGELADQLKLRFGESELAAVTTVIEAAPQAITLDKLLTELDRLGPQLTGRPASEGGWARIRREVSSLFEIKRGPAADDDPAEKLQLARLQLRNGQVAKARENVTALPGKDAAAAWLASANRYESVQAALDRLELAALRDPRDLKGADGAKVVQAGPGGV